MDRATLVGIADALHRLEAQLETQGHRLEAIGMSMDSGLTSPTHALSCAATTCASPWAGKPLPERHSSPSPTPCLEPSPASLYTASLLELRRRFEFQDSSDNEGDVAAGAPLTAPGIVIAGSQTALPDNAARTADDEIYSLSTYTPQSLSRADLSIPPEPSMPALAYESFDQQHASPMALSPFSPEPSSIGSRSSTKRSWGSTRSSIDSTSSTSTQTSHERVALTYWAYDNFKISLQSSRSPRSMERKSSRAEERRLQDLASNLGHPTITSEPPEGARNGTMLLARLFLGVFRRVKDWRSWEAAYIVA